jgi:hypothetical protein
MLKLNTNWWIFHKLLYCIHLGGGIRLMVFHANFNNISVIFIVAGENDRPAIDKLYKYHISLYRAFIYRYL